MITHFITEVIEELNYILACGLKYKDSDNVNLTRDINKVTCDKCLKNIKKSKSKIKELEG